MGIKKVGQNIRSEICPLRRWVFPDRPIKNRLKKAFGEKDASKKGFV